MEKIIDGTKYTITPATPNLSPYITLLGKLLGIEPKNTEEAENVSIEIDKAMAKLLEGTVKPKPKQEHFIQLYSAVIEETNKEFEKAGLFRRSGKPNIKKGSTDGASNP